MRVLTANLNGARAAARRGGFAVLAGLRADVLLLQEVRCSTAVLAELLDEHGLGEYWVSHTEGSVPGRAGVAVLSRAEPESVRRGFADPHALNAPVDEFADAGRWLEVDLDVAGEAITVASLYVHTGEAGTERQDEKHRFLSAMQRRLVALGADGGLAVIGGDINVAPDSRDIKNWKGNVGKAGFLPSEQEYLRRWVAEPIAWADLGRDFAGDCIGPYTWWSWRGRAFDNDSGWRIDVLYASPALAVRMTSVEVGRAESYAARWSDHASVMATFAW